MGSQYSALAANAMLSAARGSFDGRQEVINGAGPSGGGGGGGYAAGGGAAAHHVVSAAAAALAASVAAGAAGGPANGASPLPPAAASAAVVGGFGAPLATVMSGQAALGRDLSTLPSSSLPTGPSITSGGGASGGASGGATAAAGLPGPHASSSHSQAPSHLNTLTSIGSVATAPFAGAHGLMAAQLASTTSGGGGLATGATVFTVGRTPYMSRHGSERETPGETMSDFRSSNARSSNASQYRSSNASTRSSAVAAAASAAAAAAASHQQQLHLRGDGGGLSMAQSTPVHTALQPAAASGALPVAGYGIAQHHSHQLPPSNSTQPHPHTQHHTPFSSQLPHLGSSAGTAAAAGSSTAAAGTSSVLTAAVSGSTQLPGPPATVGAVGAAGSLPAINSPGPGVSAPGVAAAPPHAHPHRGLVRHLSTLIRSASQAFGGGIPSGQAGLQQPPQLQTAQTVAVGAVGMVLSPGRGGRRTGDGGGDGDEYYSGYADGGRSSERRARYSERPYRDGLPPAAISPAGGRDSRAGGGGGAGGASVHGGGPGTLPYRLRAAGSALANGLFRVGSFSG